MTPAQLQDQYRHTLAIPTPPGEPPIYLRVLSAGEELPGINRNLWAAYNPVTGETFMFRNSPGRIDQTGKPNQNLLYPKEVSSFGTYDEVLDALTTYVNAENSRINAENSRSAVETLGEETRRRAVTGTLESLGEGIEAQRRAREQPAQAAAETPAQAGARTTEGGERRGTVVIGEGEQERAALPSQPSRGGVETREIVRGTPVGTQRTGRTATEAVPQQTNAQLGVMADALEDGTKVKFGASRGGETFSVMVDPSKLDEGQLGLITGRMRSGSITEANGFAVLLRYAQEEPGSVTFTDQNGNPLSAREVGTRLQ
jgi:hypothetical protein